MFAKKEDDDRLGRKVTLYLIRGLVLIEFVVAPVAAGTAAVISRWRLLGRT